jgi:hypothetical protein
MLVASELIKKKRSLTIIIYIPFPQMDPWEYYFIIIIIIIIIDGGGGGRWT